MPPSQEFPSYGSVMTGTTRADDFGQHNNNNKEETTQNESRSVPVGEHSDSSGRKEDGRLLRAIPFAVLVFYSVSGGPFGVEESVRSAGAFYTLVGFTIMPFVWSVQEAMVTTELSTAYPEASGGVAWVEEAFGQEAGFMAGYLSWVAGATDNAIYPVLFMDYLLQIVKDSEGDVNYTSRFLILSAISVGLACVNWRGLTLVGNMSIGICLLSMSPFIALCIIGAFKVHPHRWFQGPSVDSMQWDETDDDISTNGNGGMSWSLLSPQAFGSVMWRPFLNNLFWNLNSFDSAASFAGDVEDPARVFPRAMFWSVVMVVLGYLVPLLVALGASDAPQSAWVDGYLTTVASDIGGRWLGAWTVFAAGISNIALFQAELSTDAYMLMGMAHRGFVPKIFGRRSRYGTPTYPIILCTVVIVMMGVADFDELIEMLNFNYSFALLLEYASFIKLRITKDGVHRPCRIPLSTWGCVLLLLPTIFFTLMIVVLASYTTCICSLFTNLVGIMIYRTHQKFYGCCEYTRIKTTDEEEVVREDESSSIRQ